MSMQATYRYQIDAENHIVSVSDDWLAFARANGAPQLTRDKVLGRRLDHFIIGLRAADLYTGLFAVLRNSGAMVSIPFRCDAPDMKRHMELKIAPQADGNLILAGRLLRAEPRPRVPLLDLQLLRNDRVQTICAICRRLLTADDTWREVEDALDDPYAVPAQGLPQLRHDVCPDCINALRKAAAPNSDD